MAEGDANAMSDANTILMRSIKEHWSAEIAAACQASSVLPAFLAALIANESDGKNDAQRFEPVVFERLKEVLLGARPHYAPAGIKRPITKQDLLAYCDPGTPEERGDFSTALQCLHNLATSWGLTQIMGWHLVEFNSGLGTAWLATPGGNLQFATRLLAWFAEHYDLDRASEHAKFLACWNTGEPMGVTYDPQYIPKGIARMAIWDKLA
jgi:hypothetical protein